MTARSILTYALFANALGACSSNWSEGQGESAMHDELTSRTNSPPASATDAAAPEASADGGTTKPPPAEDDKLDDFAKKVLARAKQWVDVKMPYCGGVNGGTDYICGNTCQRSGAHAKPEWDGYRTDCSGFVSWSWGLPGPGRVTGDLAPFNIDITTAIPVDELQPGDALNNDSHIMLFGGWENAEHTKARLLEEYDCGQVAVDRIRDVSKLSEKRLRAPGGDFTAIRLDSRPKP
jgi:hypothetical protein